MGEKCTRASSAEAKKCRFSIFVLRNLHLVCFLTLRSMRLTISAVFKKETPVKYWWMSNYPCKFSTLCYIIVCNLSGSTIYFHSISIRTIFGKNVRNVKCMSLCCLQILPVTFLNLKIIKKCTTINVQYIGFHLRFQIYINILNRYLEKSKL
jgi:hypothetical protein